jgi:hypothetical protein
VLRCALLVRNLLCGQWLAAEHIGIRSVLSCLIPDIVKRLLCEEEQCGVDGTAVAVLVAAEGEAGRAVALRAGQRFQRGQVTIGPAAGDIITITA